MPRHVDEILRARVLSSAGARMLVVAVAAMMAVGCGRRAGSRVAPCQIASDAPQKAIEMYDTDKNGVLDGTELDKTPGLRAGFAQAGSVTADDIATRIADWKKKKFGRHSFFVGVTRNGRPIEGAIVSLVPEPFLGSAMQTASGTTDVTGGAMPTAPLADGDYAPGVPPGFYRIEVTKPGENIPARYNTETIFGVEAPVYEEATTTFDLKY